MTGFYRKLFIVCSIVLSSSVITLAEPKNTGFFNKEELDKGFFADPTAEPTTAAVLDIPESKPTNPTVAATPTEVPTVPPVSNADVAREIVKSGSQSIEQLKGLQSSPFKQEQLNQSLQGVKDSLDQQLQRRSPSLPPPDGRPTPVPLVPPENLLDDYQVNDSPAEIVVVVKAEPRASFLRTLDRVYVAVSKLKVTVTKIFVIGRNKDLQQFLPDRAINLEKLNSVLNALELSASTKQQVLIGVQETIPNSQILLEKLNFQIADNGKSAAEIIQEYALHSSPAWIINSDSKLTVIQGELDPREFLKAEGKLNPELRENELGGSPFGLLKGAKENSITKFNYVPPPVEKPRVTKVLPICTRARIRRMHVGPATFGAFFSPEVLVYSPEDPEQLQLAEQCGGSIVPYSLVTNASQAQAASPLLSFILSYPLRCLPTRMHYVNVGGRQYLELRQGEAAWKN